MRGGMRGGWQRNENKNDKKAEKIIKAEPARKAGKKSRNRRKEGAEKKTKGET